MRNEIEITDPNGFALDSEAHIGYGADGSPVFQYEASGYLLPAIRDLIEWGFPYSSPGERANEHDYRASIHAYAALTIERLGHTKTLPATVVFAKDFI